MHQMMFVTNTEICNFRDIFHHARKFQIKFSQKEEMRFSGQKLIRGFSITKDEKDWLSISPRSLKIFECDSFPWDIFMVRGTKKSVNFYSMSAAVVEMWSHHAMHIFICDYLWYVIFLL